MISQCLSLAPPGRNLLSWAHKSNEEKSVENELQKSDVEEIEEITAVVCYEYYDRYPPAEKIKYTFKDATCRPTPKQLATRAYLESLSRHPEASWLHAKVLLYARQYTVFLGAYYFKNGESADNHKWQDFLEKYGAFLFLFGTGFGIPLLMCLFHSFHM